jgi:hypothetical protein
MSFVDPAILSFPPLWLVSTAGKPDFNGEIQSRTIGAGLTSRDNLAKHRQRKCAVSPGFKNVVA